MCGRTPRVAVLSLIGVFSHTDAAADCRDLIVRVAEVCQEWYDVEWSLCDPGTDCEALESTAFHNDHYAVCAATTPDCPQESTWWDEYASGQSLRGTAYAFGVFDTPLEFQERVKGQGKGIGNHKCHYPTGGGQCGYTMSQWFAGTECKGWVAFAYLEALGIDLQFSGSCSAIYASPTSAGFKEWPLWDSYPGDVGVSAGHMLIRGSYVIEDDAFNVYESAGLQVEGVYVKDGTVKSTLPRAVFEGSNPVYKLIRRIGIEGCPAEELSEFQLMRDGAEVVAVWRVTGNRFVGGSYRLYSADVVGGEPVEAILTVPAGEAPPRLSLRAPLVTAKYRLEYRSGDGSHRIILAEDYVSADSPWGEGGR
jgi:hypothetical protein